MTVWNALPVHPGGRLDGMHANATPGAAWMSRHRLTCLIRLDHSPFWPIGVHSGHVDTPRCSWVCAGMKANPHDRSGGLPDRPDVPTDCLSRQISVGTASYAREGWSGSVLKRSSYNKYGQVRGDTTIMSPRRPLRPAIGDLVGPSGIIELRGMPKEDPIRSWRHSMRLPARSDACPLRRDDTILSWGASGAARLVV